MSIAIGVGGLIVGALALVLGEVRSRRDQHHTLALARGERWFAVRREVYEEALRYMHRALRQVTEAHDLGAGMNPPGEPLSPDQEMYVQVRMEIFGAPEVTSTAKEFFASLRAVDSYARMKANPGDADAKRSAQSEMNKHRDEASDQVAQVEVMMREELANL
jgi:hypothetical protein